jgi:glycosyltransferase involved in cell wall biosynthesis
MTYRVLVVHNAYQNRGGEDTVVESEIALLRSYGHVVETYTRSNDEIMGMRSLTMARNTLWSESTIKDMTALIDRVRPNIIHTHNTFPLISPSIYWAAARAGVPVVQTLHNFRLLCLNALFLREGKVCEDCMGKLPWRGVVRACYRESRPASAALAAMLAIHRNVGTYQNKVARYIALNDFCRQKFIEGGLPADRVVVKPNFVDFDAPGVGARGDLLFVGRLSVEKGIASLVDAMRHVAGVNLRVVGDGPEAALLHGMPSVTCLGSQSSVVVRSEMSRALAVVVPSIWYENFGMVVLESFASGTPVVASRIGALAEIVTEGVTGLMFEPGNPIDLADKLKWALAHPDEMAVMGRNARAEYEAKYTSSINYKQLITIYESAIAELKDPENRGYCGS